jgi:hypothetical protein
MAQAPKTLGLRIDVARTLDDCQEVMAEACRLESPEEIHPMADDALVRLVKVMAKRFTENEQRVIYGILRRWEKADKYYGAPRR